jgi:predicted DNA-binding transcriptional regulator AlpA
MNLESIRAPQSDPAYLDRLIDEFEAADFLGYSVRALRNWRVRGGGPRYVKVSSRSIRYRRIDLVAWAEARLCSSTSDTPAAFRLQR